MVKKSLVLLENALVWIAGAKVFLMMALVSADALGRYALKTPLEFQFDLTSHYLMVMTATLALAWGERNGAFIRLTVLRRWLPETFRRYLYVQNNLIAAVIFLAMTWFSAERVYDAWATKDVLFGVIDWPVWLSLIWVPIGCTALSLRLLLNAFEFAFAGRQIGTVEDLEDVRLSRSAGES